MLKYNFIFCLFSLELVLKVLSEEVIVQVNEGKLKGRRRFTDENKEYYSFQGVPFAKPPIGKLRFKSPQQAETWHGIRDATRSANPAPQYELTTESVIGDEDCLYLDISSPELPKNNTQLKPVIFYIHGGGFIFGTTSVFGGDYLIEKDVVYVATQYRIGIFGFLCLDIPEAQGNMGLKDQVQALKWVKENIEKFGGDPDNITILGMSAGAASVEYLTISPLAQGLFHKAIAQSGSSLNQWAINKRNDIIIEKLSQKIGISHKDLYEVLMRMSIEDLTTISISLLYEKPQEFKGGIFFGYVPVVEKSFEESVAFLTEDTYSRLKTGKFSKIPYLSGVNRREGLMLYRYSFYKDDIGRVLNYHNFTDYLPFNISDYERIALNDNFKKVYLESLENGDYEDSPAVDFFSDIDFIAGAAIASRLISKYSHSTYFYELAFEGTKNDNNYPGVDHGDDSKYVLVSPDNPQNITAADKFMRERIIQMWTNFAKFGNPTPDKTDIVPVIWEPTDETNRKYLVLDSELIVKENLAPKRIALYDYLYENYWP